MQFNSFIYILLLLPITVIIYYLGNKINSNIGKIIIVVSSLIFYIYNDFSSFYILGISIIVNYCFAIFVSRKSNIKKKIIIFPIIINILLLLYFKYLNFSISNINYFFKTNIPFKEMIMPIGISFFSFQQISYLVSIKNNELENCLFIDYLSYILYFPKLLMGPLIDPLDFFSQLDNNDNKVVNWNNIASGIKIFSLGLFKKVMIADVFSKAVSWCYINSDAFSLGYMHFVQPTSMDWLLASLFYTFEIYFDFSGYSDMAVGSSLLFNITLPINFDSPYKAYSIRDFWKRWHISLTKFFTKYIYIPLGGSKKGLFFQCH